MQKRVTLDAAIHATGLRFNEDVIIVHKFKRYVNMPIFRAWMIDAFISYVDYLRPEKLEINEEAIFVMENLKKYKNEEGL